MSPFVVFSGKAKSGKDTAANVFCDMYQGTTVAFADPIKRFLMLAFELSEAQLWGDEKEKELPLRGRARGEALAEAFAQATALDITTVENEFSYAIGHWAKDYNEGDVVSGRRLMQTFGTECVRQMDADLWWRIGLDTGQRLLTDVRARYERTRGVVPGFPQLVPVSINLVCFTDGRFRNELLAVKRNGGLAVLVIRPSAQGGLSVDQKAHRSELELETVPRWWFDDVILNGGSLHDFAVETSRSASHLAQMGKLR